MAKEALKKYMAKHKISAKGLVEEEQDELDRTGTCGGRSIGGIGQSKELYDDDDDGVSTRHAKKSRKKHASDW